MSTYNSSSKSIHFTSAPDIRAIALPLIDQLKLNYFGYCKILSSRKFINLATSPEWSIDHYLKKKLPPAGLLDFDSTQSGFHFPTIAQQTVYGWPYQTVIEIKEKYAVENPLIIFHKTDEYLEVLLFSFSKNLSVEAILAHKQNLNNFIFFFKEQAGKILLEALKHPLSIEKEQIKLHRNHVTMQPRKYPLSFNTSKYEFFHLNRIISIGATQYLILYLLSHAYPYKLIAKEIGLSIRTIEDHVYRLKLLFQVSNKFELIQIFDSNRYL